MYLTPQNGPAVTGGGTVFQVIEDYKPGRSGATWSIDDIRCNRTYTSRFKVFTSSADVGPLAVLFSMPFRLGDSYRWPLLATAQTETDTGSFINSVKAELSDDAEDGRQWLVTVEYTPFDVVSLLGNSDIGYGQINPLDAPWLVYWGEPAKYQRYKAEDESTPDPLPYLNTVGDPLLNPPPLEESRPVLFIARNQQTYDDLWASQYKDTTNADEFLGYPPNTVKCRDIKGEGRSWDPDWGWVWYKVTFQFEFRDDDDGNGYTQLIASMGYRQKVNGTGNPVNVIDGNGAQVTDAVPLQKDGRYTPGKPPYLIPFTEFPQSTFADFMIPEDILYIASGNS